MIVKTARDMKFVSSKFKEFQINLLNKNSKAENHFENLLNKSKIPHFRERCNYKYDTRWCYYDFYIPSLRMYIEIDGKEHQLEFKKQIDREKYDIIKRKKRFLVRMTNEYVLSLSEISLKSLINYMTSCVDDKYRDNFEYKYLNNLYLNRVRAFHDMEESANFKINKEQEVYAYDHKTGEYYRFQNIMFAKLRVEMSINKLHELLEMENIASPRRRWVFGYTQKECELNVMKVFGL